MNFVRGRCEFIDALKEMDQEELKDLGCKFIMNTAASSHIDGVWESQICTIRSVLTSITEHSSRQLDLPSVRTFLYEAMAVVNSRLLTTDHLNDSTSPVPGKFVKEDLCLSSLKILPKHLTELKSGL